LYICHTMIHRKLQNVVYMKKKIDVKKKRGGQHRVLSTRTCGFNADFYILNFPFAHSRFDSKITRFKHVISLTTDKIKTHLPFEYNFLICRCLNFVKTAVDNFIANRKNHKLLQNYRYSMLFSLTFA